MPRRCALAAALLGALLLASMSIGTNAQDYTAQGPCAVDSATFMGISMPASTGCTGKQCTLKTVKVTLPAASGSAAGCPAGPYPVIAMFNGFSTIAAFYKDYARKLASYGYAVVQYDTAPLTLTPDSVEVQFLDVIIDTLKASSSSQSHVLYGRVDWDNLNVAGHSRGGKLAALQLANNPRVKACYMLDPVDNTVFSPEGPLYPSAVKALNAASPRRVAGITAASVTSFCNPANANYRGFYDALGAGSWLEVLQGATHLSFVIAPAGDIPLVCGKGPMSAKLAISISSTTMVAWFEQAVRGKAPTPEFLAYIDKQVAAKTITWAVKA